jgi:hypothetical protein
MYACDFEYDGHYLSDFGFVICTFGESGDLETLSTGYNITFNKVSRSRGRINSLTGTQYDGCVESTFQICKNTDDDDELEITQAEYRELVSWLNRHEFLPFRTISGSTEPDANTCYFNGSFNISKIYSEDKLYGLELTLETDAPYGYGVPYEHEWTVSAGESITFTDTSDESRSIRPDLTITCQASGALQITNAATLSTMRIENCVNGEIITIKGEEQIISSSLPAHKIYNDFNYEFLRIGHSFENRTNTISFSLPCKFKIKYTPIIKDIPR